MTPTAIKHLKQKRVKSYKPLTLRIKVLLLERDITVAELARRISRRYKRKLDPSTVSRVIHGNRYSDWIAHGIAKELSVPFEQIFREE